MIGRAKQPLQQLSPSKEKEGLLGFLCILVHECSGNDYSTGQQKEEKDSAMTCSLVIVFFCVTFSVLGDSCDVLWQSTALKPLILDVVGEAADCLPPP